MESDNDDIILEHNYISLEVECKWMFIFTNKHFTIIIYIFMPIPQTISHNLFVCND